MMTSKFHRYYLYDMTLYFRRTLLPPSPQLCPKPRPPYRLRALNSPVESISELMQVVQETDRGMKVDSEQRRKIEECVRRLEELQEGVETTGIEMSATWKMLWTTEKETLFILKNAHFFNKTPGEVYQVLFLFSIFAVKLINSVVRL